MAPIWWAALIRPALTATSIPAGVVFGVVARHGVGVGTLAIEPAGAIVARIVTEAEAALARLFP
jgi:hypothetical protein